MRREFHGLRIEVDGDPAAVAGAAELLGALPVAAGPPDLEIRLRASPPQPRPPGARAFYHGVVDAFLDGADVLVWDGASLARARSGGRIVEVDVAPESLRDGHAFAHVFLLIAVVVALRWRSLFHVHAGALVSPGGRGMLVAGGAGAGKSTLTLALLEAGCDYLGDDAVFVRAPADPAVLALPRAFHVAPRTATAFPRIAATLGTLLPAGEKRRLDARVAWPGRERMTMPLPGVILLPTVEGGPATRVDPVSAAEALGALIESSTYVVVGGLPGAMDHLEALKEVADGARAFRVGLGEDLLERPAETARRVLESTAPSTPDTFGVGRIQFNG
ncbi:MAG: hypothetical protein WB493_01165 [Anaeromyxobacteraceae bacterium]